jgi:nitroimidazol reductase NimA-like FMN-containing flavoprotein (pyridoxamine 5'-phosphate oxidase superfamily)
MRRKDKEIADINELLDIIAKCKFCRLGLSESNLPYVIPINYGFSYDYNDEALTLYFHSAKEGKKLDIIRKNNNACFEIDCDTKLYEGEKPCNYGYEFKSITGFGKIIFLESVDEKTAALNHIMKHQTGKDVKYDFDENELNRVTVFKMPVEEFTGKQKVLKG